MLELGPLIPVGSLTRRQKQRILLWLEAELGKLEQTLVETKGRVEKEVCRVNIRNTLYLRELVRADMFRTALSEISEKAKNSARTLDGNHDS